LKHLLPDGIDIKGKCIDIQSGGTSSSLNVHVIGMNGSLFKENDLFRTDIYKWMINNLSFAHDNDVGMSKGSKGTRYYQIEATRLSLFTLGNGYCVLQSTDMSEMGDKLLKWSES
jgi:hypothetical protein